ncbi:MAG TPA: potassium transporter TrkG, partial [Coriobacteriia bacterium]|nr:potassium transporter TrkG [Coriobacteriia bacterium]
KAISPESAEIRASYHHVKRVWLEDSTVRAAMTVTIAYVTLYTIGTLIGALYGFDFVQAAFESVSAASNTGLSCGVTSPAMPAPMKLAYMFQMWLGRLEFLSAFALGGYALAILRGR